VTSAAGNLPGLPRADRCLVMGVVNVTPDSFSDGGQWYGPDEAIAHGLELVAQGADIVDVGGESTRPGAQRISAAEELRRVGPVVTELVRAGVPTSIDTMRARVAEFALDAGVPLVNDVSGGLADPDMPRLVAAAGASYVVVHWRAHSHDMYSRASYADVVREVHDELARRIGKPKAVRAVGLANGANPIGLVAPCHRVIGANGSLTGYGGGLHRKRWLLRHEGASFRDQEAQAELT